MARRRSSLVIDVTIIDVRAQKARNYSIDNFNCIVFTLLDSARKIMLIILSLSVVSICSRDWIVPERPSYVTGIWRNLRTATQTHEDDVTFLFPL